MQAIRPKQDAKQQTIASLKTSTAAVRNSIRIMTSAVAFQRSLFPLEDFKDRDYCGIDLKILNPARKDSGAKMFMDYLEKGVFDAFQKGFVDRIMLNIHDADPLDTVSSIVESYAFRVDYDKGRIISEEPESEIAKAMRKTSKGLAASMSATRMTRDQVVQQTRALIKTLTSTMAGLPPLPDAKWITFYLTYHDHTPESYEPPLFESASSGPVPVFKSPVATLRQGGADTGYHAMEVKVRSCSEAQEEHKDDKPQRTKKTVVSAEDCELDDQDDDEEEADQLASSFFDKTRITPAHQSDDTASESSGSQAQGARAPWGKEKERMYASFARSLRAKKRFLSPRAALKQTEWATSLDAALQAEFLARYEAELEPLARPPLAERELTPATDPARAVWSQNSFESERENVPKLSRSKRPLRCPSNAGKAPQKRRRH